MPLILREFQGYSLDDAAKYVSHFPNFKEEKRLTEGVAPEGGFDATFQAVIEAMHSFPFNTRNYTRYLEKANKNALPTWTAPYNIPVIMYHNDYDGQIIGRVAEAKMAKSEQIEGSALVLTTTIPQWDAAYSIRTGLLSTVSIGVAAKDVRCSICGNQLSEGDWCEHERGHEYDGEVCYWDVYEYEAKELSFVIVPSDKYAKVLKCGYVKDNDNNDVVDKPPPRIFSLHNEESVDTETHNSNSLDIQESETASDNPEKNTERKTTTLPTDSNKIQLKEALAQVESLQKEQKALSGDKVLLQSQIDKLNDEKVKYQESIQDLTKKLEEKEAETSKKLEEKELEVANEKSMREAAEKKVEELEKEVKTSLIESYSALRAQTGKPALEKLEERSIDSLRDSISDLKAEIKEAENKKNTEDLKNAKGSVNSPALKEAEENKNPQPEQSKEQATEFEDENFEL